MRKNIAILCMAAVMLSACIKKPGEPVETTKNYKVDFRIGGLNHTVGEPNVGFPTEPIQNFIQQLSIVAYNTQTGAEVARQTQLTGTTNFGQVSFELPSGTYSFVAMGSQSEFGINQFYEADRNTPVYSAYAQANFQYWQPSSSSLDKRYKTSDTFFAKQTGVIISKNQTLEIIMDRIVGLLNVIVTDRSDYSIEITSEFSGFRFDAAVPFSTIENDFSSAVKHSKDGPISFYILKNQSVVNLHLGVGAEPAFQILVARNKRTTVRVNWDTKTYITTVE
jgi:hypothetical protein